MRLTAHVHLSIAMGVILYSKTVFGGMSHASIVRRGLLFGGVRSLEGIVMYYENREINPCIAKRPLYGRCLLFGLSANGGFTILVAVFIPVFSVLWWLVGDLSSGACMLLNLPLIF